jgi:hypothetical protein
MVHSSEGLMSALVAVRSLGLGSWCIGAGAVRSLAWDTLHGFDKPSALEDIDVVYFDDAAGDPGQETYLESQDLFALRVRHNSIRASVSTYRQRIESKRFGIRRPLLSIDAG